MINELSDALRRGDGGTPIGYAAKLARLAGLPLHAGGGDLSEAAIDAALEKQSLSISERLQFKIGLQRGGLMATRR